jgi:hypothetical protein
MSPLAAKIVSVPLAVGAVVVVTLGIAGILHQFDLPRRLTDILAGALFFGMIAGLPGAWVVFVRLLTDEKAGAES